MKQLSVVLFLILFSTTVFAQQRIRPDGMGGWIVEDTGGCGGLWGAAQGLCIAQQQRMQQQQIQQQQLLQNQIIENQRLQNEILKRDLEQKRSASQSQQAPQGNFSTAPEFQNWQSENPWFGSDRGKTEFALLYAKQLRQERPDLIGRPFLNAITTKIDETFGAA